MNASIELLLHLDTFRNIELYYQGLYKLKLKLHQHVASSSPYEAQLEPVDVFWHS